MKNWKNVFKTFGIIAVIAIIAFSTIGCGEDDGDNGDNGGGGSAFLGDTLELSGQVFEEKWNENWTSVSYTNFTGNLELEDELGGSGAITNGMLNYSIGRPAASYLLPIVDELDWGEDYNNFTISNEDTKIARISNLRIKDSDSFYDVRKSNSTVSLSSSNYTDAWEGVNYYYVDSDVTISGTGKTQTWEEDDFKETYTTTNINLALKAGWNAVHSRENWSVTFTGSFDDDWTSVTGTESMSLANPTIRWALRIDW